MLFNQCCYDNYRNYDYDESFCVFLMLLVKQQEWQWQEGSSVALHRNSLWFTCPMPANRLDKPKSEDFQFHAMRYLYLVLVYFILFVHSGFLNHRLF